MAGHRLPQRRRVCYGSAMRRFLPMLRVMFLAVLLWTGNVAHAAEDIECLTPPGAEAVHAGEADHGSASTDQTPGDSGKAHQHQSCHGHHVANPAGDSSGPAVHAGAQLKTRVADPWLAGAAVDGALRPPIA